MNLRTGFGLAIAAMMLAPLASTAALADVVNYKIELKGGSEVPANDSAGHGTLTATFDTASKKLDWKVDFADLTGPVTAAHFHGPAAPGADAPPIVPVSAPFVSPISGTVTLTDEQAKELADGKVYFNLHTEQHKGGEVRGQLIPAK